MSGTLNENFPSRSDDVPVSSGAPFTIMCAPTIGLPSVSSMVPVMTLFPATGCGSSAIAAFTPQTVTARSATAQQKYLRK